MGFEKKKGFRKLCGNLSQLKKYNKNKDGRASTQIVSEFLCSALGLLPFTEMGSRS